MELRRLWLLIWQRKVLVVVMVAAALVAGYQATPRIARYQAVSVLFVGVPEYNSLGVFSNDLQQGTAQLAGTFATMVPSLSIVESAVVTTGVHRSAGQVLSELRATVVPGTTLIHVAVTDTDPVVAQTLANGVAQAFVSQIIKIDPVTTTLNGSAKAPQSPASISQEASLPAVPLSNGLLRSLILSGIFGLLTAIGLVLLLDYLDVSVRSPADLERRIGLSVLGVIPLYPQLVERNFIVPGARPSRTAGSADKLNA